MITLVYMLLFALFCTCNTTILTKQPKIIALVPGHNDARFLPNCFRALSRYADAIVYLDDASTDNSVAIAESLAQECNIEQIIIKQEWIRNAPADRNILLYAGRALDGTHFITLDADEMFTANCMVNDKLRNHILGLKPGEQLILNWIQLWRSLDQYRHDNSVWTNNYKQFVFCDDGICTHTAGFLGEKRTPDNLQGKHWFIEGYEYGVLHFQFVNFDNLLRKQAWYRCMERIHDPKYSLKTINWGYGFSKDENGLRTLPVPTNWFEGYDFFDRSVVEQTEYWREQDVMSWFLTHGMSLFAGLDIWDIKWPFEEYIQNDSFVDTFIVQQKEQGTFLEVGTPDAQHKNPLIFLNKQRKWQGFSIYNKQINQYNNVQELDINFESITYGDFTKVAVVSVADNKILHTYDIALAEKITHEVSRFEGQYALKMLTKQLDKELSNIDMLVVHQNTQEIEELMLRLDIDKHNVEIICISQEVVNSNLRQIVEKKEFALIDYNDQGYYYFLKMHFT